MADEVQSIRKAFRLIETLSREQEMSVTQLASAIDLNKAAAFRCLATLKSLGYVEQNRTNEKYRLGLKLYEVGSKVVARIDGIREARPVIEQLAEQTGETVHLAVLDEGDVVYVDKIDSRHILRMFSRVGGRSPSWCTGLGKALLAWHSEREVGQLLKGKKLVGFTPHTITSLSGLKKELGKVRERGFAVDDQEHELGIRCVAAPVRNAAGMVVAAISISWPETRNGEGCSVRYRDLVMDAGREASQRLGF